MHPGDVSCPLGQFTVAWVRQRAAAKRLPQHKVPFLLVGVRHVEPSSRDPSVTLQDQTGNFQTSLFLISFSVFLEIVMWKGIEKSNTM
jgi:hypothetical protein